MVFQRKVYIVVYLFQSEEKRWVVFRRKEVIKNYTKYYAHLFFPGRPLTEVFFGFNSIIVIIN